MMRSARLLVVSLSFLGTSVFMAPDAEAITITIAGVDSGSYSSAEAVVSFNPQTNTLTYTVTNTSAITQPGSTSTITSIGFDLPPTGNASASGLNGFTGAQAPSLSSNFAFSDAALGSVPHGFGNVVLDFGFLTGASGNFSGGSANDGLLPGESASFVVSGAAFAGFTEALIANSMFVRFQNVPLAGGSNGSDVGTPYTTTVPDGGTTLSLLGLGLLGLGYVRRRTQ